MSRIHLLIAALLGTFWLWQPLAVAQSSSKKSSSKTSAASKKKKSSAGTTKKPTPTPAEKTSEISSEDAPLPTKLPGPAATAEASENEKSPPTSTPAPSSTPKPANGVAKKERAPSATVEPETIIEFAEQPARIQQLIRDAIELTRQNLTYTFGSADPAKGGMDCSGTIYHVLRAHGISDVARDSSGQYLWARKHGTFFPVVSKNAESVEFEQLQPGDLLFWTGTYSTGRDVPISHVMMYLGREKGSKKRIMFGASDGRSYNGIQRWGVSVFDFKMPRKDAADGETAKVDFVGYARIPGLRTDEPISTASNEAEAEKETSPSKPAATPAPKPKSSSKKKSSSTKGKAKK